MTKLARISFNRTTDAELIMIAHSCGADERSATSSLLDKNTLTKHQRKVLTDFVKGCGYNSARIDLERRVTSAFEMVPFESCMAMTEEPDEGPVNQFVAFLTELGFTDARQTSRKDVVELVVGDAMKAALKKLRSGKVKLLPVDKTTTSVSTVQEFLAAQDRQAVGRVRVESFRTHSIIQLTNFGV